MEINEIKSRLSLQEVLNHYNLQPNKNGMLICPFHEDKTASLQVSYQRNNYKCHACDKKGDVIQFVQDYEKISKHEAILKCASLVGESIIQTPVVEPITKIESSNFIHKMFLSFRKGLLSSPPAKDYCQSRALDYERLNIGFNSGQFHHGSRKEEELISKCMEVGLLSLAGTNSRTGGQAYKPFGIKCIVFPLKNKEGETVSMYFRSTINEQDSKHFYLKNRQGLYPNYPHPDTKKLILTEAIIDSASLLQIDEIVQEYSILTCFGTNGLNDEILQAIKELKQLQEIIFCFDNDKAGNEAIIKYSKLLKDELQEITISVVGLPSKDINETLQLHEKEIFIELLEKRQSLVNKQNAIENFSSIEKPSDKSEQAVSSRTNVREPSLEETQNTLNLNSSIDFLKHNNLLKNLNELIGKAGIVGEENSRMLLFLIIISYLNKNPLHALVQGSAGSGKTHMISRIADMMPPQDVLRFTRITESSLYNWGEFDLFQKVIIIEDLDGLKEEALYALRELISNQILSSSVSMKDKKGNNKSTHKIVKGQFSSLSATTKGETYEDNMSRSFLIAVDESKEQTARIIEYQNRRIAGEIDPNESQKAIHFIQNLVRNLKT